MSRAARSKSPSLKGLESQRHAGLVEKAFGVGAGHIARDEDHAAGQRRSRRRHRAVELHAVDARHLQVADDQIVGGSVRRVRPSSPSPARSTTKPASLQRLGTATASAGSSSTTSTRNALEGLERHRRRAAPARPAVPALTRDRQLDEERRAAPVFDCSQMRPPCSCTIA